MNSLTKTYTFVSPVILAFPKRLFVPEGFTLQDGKKTDPKYGCDFLLRHSPSPDGLTPASPEFAAIKSLIEKLIQEKWPGANPYARDEITRQLSVMWPWYNGDNRADEIKQQRAEGKKTRGGKLPMEMEFARGHAVLHATAQRQPALCGVENGSIVTYENERLAHVKDKLFFFGAEVFAEINFVAADPQGQGTKPYVASYLSMVLGTGRGKRIGDSRNDPTEVFSGYVGKISAENPTVAAASGNVPF